MLFVKKIQLSHEIFPVNYYDDEVPLTFYCNDKGEKHQIILSLKNSISLHEEVIVKKNTSYEELAKIGIDKLENLKNEDRKHEYRYMKTFASICNKEFIVIFNFKENREYYSCRVFGVIEIEKN
jgi:hypothetical protein